MLNQIWLIRSQARAAFLALMWWTALAAGAAHARLFALQPASRPLFPAASTLGPAPAGFPWAAAPAAAPQIVELAPVPNGASQRSKMAPTSPFVTQTLSNCRSRDEFSGGTLEDASSLASIGVETAEEELLKAQLACL